MLEDMKYCILVGKGVFKQKQNIGVQIECALCMVRAPFATTDVSVDGFQSDHVASEVFKKRKLLKVLCSITNLKMIIPFSLHLNIQ